MEPPDYF